jgi:hypothetical protein
MREQDKIWVKFLSIEKAEVGIFKSKDYKWMPHVDDIPEEGDEYYAYPPFNFYITGYANWISKGSFSFKTWVQKGDSSAPIAVFNDGVTSLISYTEVERDFGQKLVYLEV